MFGAETSEAPHAKTNTQSTPNTAIGAMLNLETTN